MQARMHKNDSTHPRAYTSIDEALSIFARTGPEYGRGLANHGPMAAEAMCAMGRDEAVAPWVERYRKGLEAHPAPSGRINETHWREALGKSDRVGDWIAFFNEALKEAAWQRGLDRWVTWLAPGIAAAAFHGVIRTGHAARALADQVTPIRTSELAEGLGYWAATYQAL